MITIYSLVQNVPGSFYGIWFDFHNNYTIAPVFQMEELKGEKEGHVPKATNFVLFQKFIHFCFSCSFFSFLSVVYNMLFENSAASHCWYLQYSNILHDYFSCPRLHLQICSEPTCVREAKDKQASKIFRNQMNTGLGSWLLVHTAQCPLGAKQRPFYYSWLSLSSVTIWGWPVGSKRLDLGSLLAKNGFYILQCFTR